MFRRVFFKLLLFFTFLFISGVSFVIALNPSFLFLEDNRVNTSNKEMILLITPESSFSSGSELTVLFPTSEATQWCKDNDVDIAVEGVASSKVDLEGWNIDGSLPGELSARCFQDSGDKIVISGIDELSAGASYAVKLGPNSNLSTSISSGTKNVVVRLTRGLISEATAFSLYIQDAGAMTVTAFVNTDNFSSVQVNPSIVEIGMPSTARVTVLDSKGNPINNRDVQFSLQNVGNMSNWSIVSSTGKTGSNGRFETQIIGSEIRVVTISAVDKSFASDVTIQGTATLRVRAVPTVTLNSLPLYSVGRSREITWTSLGSGYTYRVESSKDPEFKTVEQQSGWISNNNFTFENLNHGESYYYRAQVKNSANFTGAYSNIVSSVQSERPSGAVRVLNSTVEKGINSDLEVTVVDSQGNPMSGRTIVLEVDRPDKSKWVIQQPSVTDSEGIARGKIYGLEVANAKITAVDTTLGTQTYLEGFDWLRVVELPKPNLNSLSEYSKGLTRSISWSLLSGSYQYEVESSSNTDFSVSKKSGWILANNYLFSDLSHGEAYFYRARVKNTAGIVGPYSDVVSSIQDNQAPSIEKTAFEALSREGQKSARFTFVVKSLSPVSKLLFECKDTSGNFVECGSMRSSEDFHYVTITEEELQGFQKGAVPAEKKSFVTKVNAQSGQKEYTLEYCFEAEDIVGNNGRFCREETFTLENPIIEEVVSQPEQQGNIVTRTFAPIVQNIQKGFENTVVFIQDLDVDDATVQTVSLVVASTVAPATIFTVLLNPSNYQASGQLFLGLAGIFRRKRKILPYGYVYDSVTKEPINKAIVRIYRNGKLLATTVSNVYGVFNADLEPGEYEIKIFANEYAFPTKLITGSIDSPLENIYKGGRFVVQEESQIKYSIPLDPISASTIVTMKTLVKSHLGKFLVAFQKVLVFVGLFISLFMYIRNPDTLNIAILLFYIPLLFIHMFLSLGSNRQSFGLVKDEKGNLLKGLSLGLREMEFEKLEAKRITNDYGRYRFLVPGGNYKLEVLTPGYEIVNLKENALYFKGNVKKPLLINRSLVLRKKENEGVKEEVEIEKEEQKSPIDS